MLVLSRSDVLALGGTALQDVAAAVAVYDRARAVGRGVEITLDA
jgi:ornithine cyclodeaminase/alanine dehydrogenase-like protein (mu-crystallin family)